MSGEETTHEDARPGRTGVTSLHVRRILEERGEESWLWLVERFNPLLELQVAYRLRGDLRRICDAEDLINDAWMVTFLRLPTLRARDGRWTPVLLRFLSTTLINKMNEVMRREIHRRVSAGSLPDSGEGARSAHLDLEQRVTTALAAAARSEAHDLLHAALATLTDEERDIVVLRGIEQVPNQRAAQRLGLGPSTVAMRWSRALKKLRRKLPDSVFAELPEDGDQESDDRGEPNRESR
jgi:RNA polymerase sigma factor (sigma-70 family)